MKPRPTPASARPSDQALQVLADAIASLQSGEEVAAFLRDLCTPAELEAMVDRWGVVPLLLRGVPHREIYELTGVSVTTSGRSARPLGRGAGRSALAPGRSVTASAETTPCLPPLERPPATASASPSRRAAASPSRPASCWPPAA